MKYLLFLYFLISIFSSASTVLAEDVYQTPQAFISESFESTPPAPKKLDISDDLKIHIKKIMGSHYKLPSTQYWTKKGRTAWILEDIGKFEPITAGFVVGDNNSLERIKVLIYRESHGWEVKHDFFTRQFQGTELKNKKRLNRRIDGISGATLSVNTLKRLSALALLLHEQVKYTP